MGLVGSGKMGKEIFTALSEVFDSLVWITKTEEDAHNLINKFQKRISRQLKNGLITPADYDKKNRQTIITADLDALKECHLITESISEDLTKKRELFKKLHQIAQKECIISSNTSSLLPSQLCPHEDRRPYFLGIHYFYPTRLKNIVEIIKTEYLSPRTLDTVNSFLKYFKTRGIILNEKNAFILNRVLLNMQAKAFELVNEGVPAELIDRQVRENLLPIGVFELMEHVGLQVMESSIRNYMLNWNEYAHCQSMLGQIKKMNTNHINLLEGLTQGLNNTQNDQSEQTAKNILKTLKDELSKSIQSILTNHYLTRDDLDYALKEYFTTQESLLDKLEIQ